jgi:hypothetical protein
MTLNDYLSCSNRTFSQLDFKFTNTEGLELPIYGIVWHPERMKHPVLPNAVRKLLEIDDEVL